MKTSTLAVLVVLALLAIAGAAVAVRMNQAAVSPTMAPATGARLLPDLASASAKVAKIEVRSRSKALTLVKQGEQWTLPERAGYPVLPERIRDLINGMAELRAFEPRTTRPEAYDKLGVQDPTPPPTAAPPASPPAAEPAASQTPIGVTLLDDAGKPIAGLIVGNYAQAANRPGLFVRLPGQPQSWLAEGRLEVRAEPNGWLDTQVVALTRDRIRQVTVNHPPTPEQPAGEILLISRETRETPAFTLSNLPSGRELSSPTAPDALANALAYLSFEDVRRADSIAFSAPTATTTPGPTTEFRTFDGLVLSIQSATQDARTYVSFAASIDESSLPPAPPPATPASPDAAAPATPPPTTNPAADAIRKEADTLNKKLAGWAYVLQGDRAKALATRTIDLLKAPEPKP